MTEPDPEAPPPVAPCGWDPAPCCDDLRPESTVEDAVRLNALAVATHVLWALSGRRYGACPTVVRPCRTDCARGHTGGAPFTPALIGGTWRNLGCGACGDLCSCDRLCEILLPGPVAAVTEILVDGEALDADDYVVYDRRRLVRVDGDCWPLCNDLALPPTETGTWQVTYDLGLPVPAAANWAAGILACELVKACGGQACRLPARVTHLSRQGVDLTLVDPQDFLDKGRTGLVEVDLFLAADNPNGLTSPSRVYSPDRPPPRHPAVP